MKIEYYKKNIYGNELMYIKDEVIAKNLTALLGTKSILSFQMNRLSALFGVEWIQVLP